MKRIGLLSRQKMVQEIRERYKETNACIFIGFHKLKAAVFNKLRNDLRQADTRVLVAKSSLIRRVWQELGISLEDGFLKGATALVFIYGDVVKSCKILVNFSKENEGLVVKGGFLEDKILSSKEIIELSKLPSREILLGMAVGSLVSPLTGFLSLLNQIIIRFLWVITRLKEKKEKKE